MLEQLSMIIPMKDNHHMLDEILHYHAPTSANIFIVHDSINPYSLTAKLKKFSNIYYYHMHNVDYNARVQFVLEKIKTPYCVFRADRRHVSNNSLKKSLFFLQNNPDFSSASGVWMLENYMLQNMVELICPNGLNENAYERVQFQALSYQPTYYNIQKTNLIKAFFEILTHLQGSISNIYYNEFLHSFLCFYLGKTKQFNHFTGITQNKNSPSPYKNEWHQVINIFQNAELTNLVTLILKSVLKKYNFTIDNIAKSLQAFHDAMAIKFLAYRSNTYEMEGELVKTFGYLENIFSMLNNKTPRHEKLMEYYMRAFLTKNFDVYARYDDVKSNFDDCDYKEMDNILQLMVNINKKASLCDDHTT